VDISSITKIKSIKKYDNLKPLYCSPNQLKLLNKSLLPVIISKSDDDYTGILYGFYNKKIIKKMKNKDYYDIIMSALPNDLKQKLLPHIIKNNEKKSIDNWLVKNNIIEKFLKNKLDRSTQNFELFYKTLESKRSKL